MAANDHSSAHGNGHAHEHSSKMYIITFVVLAFFTALTFLLAEKDFGRWSFVIAMAIACTKASFVVLFFMHLWDQPGPNRLTMAISLAFLATLITFTLADIATRFPLALPPGSHRSLHIDYTTPSAPTH
jgi:cytochrome c oxidase subunit 4